MAFAVQGQADGVTVSQVTSGPAMGGCSLLPQCPACVSPSPTEEFRRLFGDVRAQVFAGSVLHSGEFCVSP